MKEHFCPAEQSTITYQGECSWCGEIEGGMIEVIKDILTGIDQTGIESSDGWWETSTGAKFGAEKLKQIEEALAQPKQEPDYWLGYGLQAHTEKPFEGATPVWTSPPQRTWVGLTRNEQSFVYSNLHNATSREDSFWVDFANAIEAKLKEKNGA